MGMRERAARIGAKITVVSSTTYNRHAVCAGRSDLHRLIGPDFTLFFCDGEYDFGE
jgi:hypothetical protein